MNRPFTAVPAATHSPLLRAWAGATCAATFALLVLGTLVTTFRVGMADRVWPTAPWHLLLIEWSEPQAGFLIEHAHRIAGYLVGVLILGQAVWLGFGSRGWARLALVLGVSAAVAFGMRAVKLHPDRSVEALAQPAFAVAAALAVALLGVSAADLWSGSADRWARAFAALAFVGVVVQGLLGGLRVYLNELLGPNLAVVHGLFAQVVFALTALVALTVSRRWTAAPDACGFAARRPALLTLLLFAALIVFGGLLRHQALPVAQRLHPLLAFAAAAGVTLTAVRAFAQDGDATLRPTAALLAGLVALQVALGVEAWIMVSDPAFRFRPVGVADAVVRSAHVLTGFAVFATACVLTARAWRHRMV